MVASYSLRMRIFAVQSLLRISILLSLTVSIAGAAQVDALGGRAVVQSLQRGGYIIVMRHASSPQTSPDKISANPDNVKMERQLDETGRATARAMGIAFRDLKIPIGEIWTSPTYRAMETVRLANFDVPTTSVVTTDSLGDSGQSMQAANDAQSEWLRKRVTQGVRNTNVLVVTHSPNISRAFPNIRNVDDGEALIFSPDNGGTLVARVKIGEWPQIPKN
jgi:broad specificity phosphatase PhoE